MQVLIAPKEAKAKPYGNACAVLKGAENLRVSTVTADRNTAATNMDANS